MRLRVFILDVLAALMILTGSGSAYRNYPWPEDDDYDDGHGKERKEGEEYADIPREFAEPSQTEDDSNWELDGGYNWPLWGGDKSRTEKKREKDKEEEEEEEYADIPRELAEPSQTEDDSDWELDGGYNWPLWGGDKSRTEKKREKDKEEEEEPYYDDPYAQMPYGEDLGELPSPSKIWGWVKEKFSRSPKPPASPAKRTQEQTAALKAIKHLITAEGYTVRGVDRNLDECDLTKASLLFLLPPDGFELKLKSRPPPGSSASSKGPPPATAIHRSRGGHMSESTKRGPQLVKGVTSRDIGRPEFEKLLDEILARRDEALLPSDIWEKIADTDHGQRKIVYLARALQVLGSKAKDLINFSLESVGATKKTQYDLCQLQYVGDQVASQCPRK